MKALFCLYSAPLMESARSSSAPLVGNLGPRKSSRMVGEWWHRAKNSFLLGSLAQSISLCCLHLWTAWVGEHGGFLWCPALCKLGKKVIKQGMEQTVMPGKRKNKLQWKSAPTLQGATQQGTGSGKTIHVEPQMFPTCAAHSHFPACCGLSIPTSPASFPALITTSHSSGDGSTCAPTAPKPRRWPQTEPFVDGHKPSQAGRACANKYFSAIPQHRALSLAQQTWATCDTAQLGSLLPENNSSSLCKAHHGS